LYGYVLNDPVNWIDPLGLDLDVYVDRDYADRRSPGNIKAVENGKTICSGRANENPFYPNSQGVKAGSYDLKQKGDSWGPGRYPSTQPAITGPGNLKPGQPNNSYVNPALIHTKGTTPGRPDSSACVTVDDKVNQKIMDALGRNPDSSRIHITEPNATNPPIKRATLP
jgi:uncharacterized protein RhaS with RHS repeats